MNVVLFQMFHSKAAPAPCNGSWIVIPELLVEFQRGGALSCFQSFPGKAETLELCRAPPAALAELSLCWHGEKAHLERLSCLQSLEFCWELLPGTALWHCWCSALLCVVCSGISLPSAVQGVQNLSLGGSAWLLWDVEPAEPVVWDGHARAQL